MNRIEKNKLEKKKTVILKRRIIKLSGFLFVFIGMVIYHNYKLDLVRKESEREKRILQYEIKETQNDVIAYKSMFEYSDKEVKTCRIERDKAIEKYNYIQEQIKYSKLADKQEIASRGGFENHDLRSYPIITIDEMNEYINNQVPEDSPYRNKGELFLQASKLTNQDPRYLFAHASVETGYGTSNLAITKGNHFGINAVNNDPNRAYHMGSTLDDGIINGSDWISNNYTNNGKSTLTEMANNGYALYDNGSPNTKWIADISHIAMKYYK